MRDVQLANLREGFERVDRGRSAGIHLWDDTTQTERRTEKCKQRERAEIDLAGFNAVQLLQEFHLLGEDAVRVLHALRQAGTATGE